VNGVAAGEKMPETDFANNKAVKADDQFRIGGVR
jgi:hypothetical protein